MIRAVSMLTKEQYDSGCNKLLNSLDNWPSGTEFVCYIDGFRAPNHPILEQIGIGKVTRLTEFAKAHAGYIPPSTQYDVVASARRAFVAHAALRDHDGIGVWIDPRFHVYKPFHEGWIQAALGDAYIAVLRRKGMSSDTSFWIVNCAHEHHKEFMDTWIQWYESGSFKGLANWTDGESLDATIRKFEKAGKIKSISLSGGHEDKLVPLAFAPIAAFVE